jgi:putative ABC transport system substrate-binding protein
MDRRTFLAGTGALLLAAPLAAEAQRTGKVYRIGMLETTPTTLNTANLNAFRQGLRELGYVEGQNFIIEYRSADGRHERVSDLATELVRLKVDVIVTRGTPAALAAKNSTRTIPIVMAASADPVGTGVVASLARPGGNITGLSAAGTELSAKRLELLREILPQVSRIAALFDMSDPASPPQWKEVEAAARSRGLQLQLLDVRKSEDLGRAFTSANRERAGGLVVGSAALTRTDVGAIATLAAKHRLPTIFQSREFVDAGGLISYGVSFPPLYRRAAIFVDKILRGAKPADLPVEEPTTFELIVNLKTAKALGLTIPPSLLGRADEIIQ